MLTTERLDARNHTMKRAFCKSKVPKARHVLYWRELRWIACPKFDGPDGKGEWSEAELVRMHSSGSPASMHKTKPPQRFASFTCAAVTTRRVAL